MPLAAAHKIFLIMKYLSLIFSFVLFAGLQLQAQDATVKTETFKVYGNCGMCKGRIEGALKKMAGVNSADWNSETKVLEVNYDAAQTNIDEMQKTIAGVGHDTDKYRADDKVYENLPGCCMYDRPAAADAVGSAAAVQPTGASFTVYGNCGMCKGRIERALRKMAGVNSAEWNSETKVLKVSYDAAQTNVDEMQKIIAGVGHDTDKYRADDIAYEKLPGCCHYDRPKS